MVQRQQLGDILSSIPGVAKVYYQPPEGMKLKYPAITYSRSSIQGQHADNIRYRSYTAYQVTVISSDPDSPIVTAVLSIPYCRHNTHYVKDGLHHDIFTIYF